MNVTIWYVRTRAGLFNLKNCIYSFAHRVRSWSWKYEADKNCSRKFYLFSPGEKKWLEWDLPQHQCLRVNYLRDLIKRTIGFKNCGIKKKFYIKNYLCYYNKKKFQKCVLLPVYRIEKSDELLEELNK